MEKPLDGRNPGWGHLYACLREEVDHGSLQSVLTPSVVNATGHPLLGGACPGMEATSAATLLS